MKITKKHVDNLINHIENVERSGKAVVSVKNIQDLFDIMGIDKCVLEYINAQKFIDELRHNKLLYWNKITFLVKDNSIHFFRYISREVV